MAALKPRGTASGALRHVHTRTSSSTMTSGAGRGRGRGKGLCPSGSVAGSAAGSASGPPSVTASVAGSKTGVRAEKRRNAARSRSANSDRTSHSRRNARRGRLPERRAESTELPCPSASSDTAEIAAVGAAVSMAGAAGALPAATLVQTAFHLPTKVDYYPGALAPALFKLFRHVSAHSEEYIGELREMVSIRSVSARPDCWPNVVRMLTMVESRLKKLGATTEMVRVATQPGVRDHDGNPLRPPPVLLASLGPTCPERRRVLVYLHVDVAGLWGLREANAPPCDLRLSEEGTTLTGRGVFECKGPLLCWLLALEALNAVRAPLPVSLKFVVQGSHEIGSPGLEQVLRARRKNFLRDIDMICVTKLSWLKESKPCVVHGLRGLVYFHLEVTGPDNNLDGGHFGGTVYEPMADLVYLMNSLQDARGEPAVEGLGQAVAPLSHEEQTQLAQIDFDCAELREALGAPRLRHEEPTQLLRHRWRLPAVSFHGIEGALAGVGVATAVPRSVVGKFSLRLVPHQTPERAAAAVRRHLDVAWAARRSANTMALSVTATARPWLEDASSPHFSAARRAVKRVHKVDADVIRDGGSMEVVLLLQRVCCRSLVVLPLGKAPFCSGGPHTADESMRLAHFLDGIKLIATYLFEVAQLEAAQPTGSSYARNRSKQTRVGRRCGAPASNAPSATTVAV